MGPVEEAGKVAGGFVDAMKAQPLSLALVLMNITLLVYMFYEASNVTQARLEAVKAVLDVQREVQQLLSKCVVPERRTELVPLPRPRPPEAGGRPPDEPPVTWVCTPENPCQ